MERRMARFIQGDRPEAGAELARMALPPAISSNSACQYLAQLSRSLHFQACTLPDPVVMHSGGNLANAGRRIRLAHRLALDRYEADAETPCVQSNSQFTKAGEAVLTRVRGAAIATGGAHRRKELA
jgi:hypothetical protein